MEHVSSVIIGAAHHEIITERSLIRAIPRGSLVAPIETIETIADPGPGIRLADELRRPNVTNGGSTATEGRNWPANAE